MFLVRRRNDDSRVLVDANMIRRIVNAAIAVVGVPAFVVALLLAFVVLPVAIAYLILWLIAPGFRFT